MGLMKLMLLNFIGLIITFYGFYDYIKTKNTKKFMLLWVVGNGIMILTAIMKKLGES